MFELGLWSADIMCLQVLVSSCNCLCMRESFIFFHHLMYSNLKLLCIYQEVDKFQDLEEDLRHRGYSGIWKVPISSYFVGNKLNYHSFELASSASIFC